MAKYRKNSVVIEAILNQNNPSDVAEFFGSDRDSRFGYKNGVWSIITLKGKIVDAQIGDWMIKGVSDDYYTYIFEKTYEVNLKV